MQVAVVAAGVPLTAGAPLSADSRRWQRAWSGGAEFCPSSRKGGTGMAWTAGEGEGQGEALLRPSGKKRIA